MRSPDLVVSLILAKNIPSRYTFNQNARHKANAVLPFINPNSKAGGIRKRVEDDVYRSSEGGQPHERSEICGETQIP